MTLRVMTVLGTRPEIIRLSRVLPRLDEIADHILVHTGQNYDPELSQAFFEELGVRLPDHLLNTDTGSLGAFLGSVLAEVEVLILRYRPDALLVLGDTNSSVAALIARRLKVTVYHMEAGNRCFDENVPEEVNRRMVDHLADFNLVYTEHARRNLLGEGLHPRRVYLTGSPLGEVLSYYRGGIDRSQILGHMKLEERSYFLASIHREENVDNPKKLRTLIDALDQLASIHNLPVIVSTHPRTRKRLDEFDVSIPGLLRFCRPFGFYDYNRLQLSARCVLSDSGTISEESLILGFPALSIRDAIERPEALDSGGMIITGIDSETIIRSVGVVLSQWDSGMRPEAPAEYQVLNCSQRVVNLVTGTARLNGIWSNLTPMDQRNH
jgi:UDP-N-acetylglucosamine 2-epimerase